MTPTPTAAQVAERIADEVVAAAGFVHECESGSHAIMLVDDFTRNIMAEAIASALRARDEVIAECRRNIAAVVDDAESKHPGGWGPDVSTVGLLVDLLSRIDRLGGGT